jgi:hypothetical protein
LFDIFVDGCGCDVPGGGGRGDDVAHGRGQRDEDRGQGAPVPRAIRRALAPVRPQGNERAPALLRFFSPLSSRVALTHAFQRVILPSLTPSLNGQNRYYPDKLIGAMALKTQLKRWVKRGHMEQVTRNPLFDASLMLLSGACLSSLSGLHLAPRRPLPDIPTLTRLPSSCCPTHTRHAAGRRGRYLVDGGVLRGGRQGPVQVLLRRHGGLLLPPGP